LSRDGVHAVGGRADEDAVDAGHAEAPQQGVDGLIAADADEQVVRGEGLLGVGVGRPQVAEQLLEVGLVRVRVPVQALDI